SYSGECVMFARQGVGYWLAIWAPGGAGARGEWDALRRRFTLLKENREGWKERATGQTLTGRSGRYTLHDEQGLWREWDPPTDYDPAADLALVVKEQGEGAAKLDLVSATFLVLMPKASAKGLDEAVKAARARAEERPKSLGLPTTIEPLGAAA